MGLRDDEEDLFISRSNEDAFLNPEKGKQEAREQKAKSKGKLMGLQRLLLKKQVGADPDVAAAEADAETKRLQKLREEEEQTETFGTKTHMQMEESETMDAQKKLTSEEILKMEEEEEKQKDQSGQEYAGEEA